MLNIFSVPAFPLFHAVTDLVISLVWLSIPLCFRARSVFHSKTHSRDLLFCSVNLLRTLVSGRPGPFNSAFVITSTSTHTHTHTHIVPSRHTPLTTLYETSLAYNTLPNPFTTSRHVLTTVGLHCQISLHRRLRLRQILPHNPSLRRPLRPTPRCDHWRRIRLTHRPSRRTTLHSGLFKTDSFPRRPATTRRPPRASTPKRAPAATKTYEAFSLGHCRPRNLQVRH